MYRTGTTADDGVMSVADTGLSWTNSIPDLKNSQSDTLIESLLEPTAAEAADASNRADRSQNRHDSIFALFPPQSEVIWHLVVCLCALHLYITKYVDNMLCTNVMLIRMSVNRPTDCSAVVPHI